MPHPLLFAALGFFGVNDTSVDFEKDVRPILAKSCIRCHGAKKAEGGLALDSKPRALAGGDNGPAFVPGKAAESRLFRFVAGLDEETVMPPDGDELPAAQVAVLKAWIDQGAVWPDTATATTRPAHWAFQKPARPTIPTVKDPSKVRNPIDAFVLARLDKERLTPSSEADKPTLIRRLSLDLTGLPPTVEEVDSFLADPDPGAYERLVERLLASPAYGERWARFWLDRARFADTNGYEKDRERSVWPYRDWVIQALNADLPFDRFTIDQIAGDLRPDPDTASRIATGFHRNTMVNEEGGIDIEEFRFASLVDRVNTTGAVWLGLTIGCCQCHSHKYDPFTQREYYQLLAFLNNADEPEMGVPDAAIAHSRDEIEARIRALESSRAEKFPGGSDALASKQAAWEAAQHPTKWEIARPSHLQSKKHATMSILPDGSVLATGDKPNNDVYTVEIPVTTPGVTALRLEVLPDPSLPDNGPGRAPLFSVGDFLLTEFLVDAGSKALQRVKIAEASQDYSEPGHPASLCIDGVTDTGWSIKGGVGKAHAAVFRFKAPVDTSRLVVTMHQEYIHQMTIGRFRLSTTTDAGAIKASGLPAEIEEALLIPSDQRSADQSERIRDHYLSVAPDLKAINKQITDLRASEPKFPTSLVMQERAVEHARVTKVRRRGEFLKEADPVEPGVPAVLHSLAKGVAKNRLTFARWLVSDDNPLVGRVVMNQVWQSIFGQGLVTTSEDFGTRGARPSHPELLDWLAVEFRARGWSLKTMMRALVTSATYRQASTASSALQARDPKNELLARGPRFRVDAEVVRDLALASSGLLSRKIGGPSVFPPQPEGVTSLAYGGGGWRVSSGEDRYRRGLYTYLKRTAPYAAFIVMDAPTSDTVCVRRERSNTPLQALTLLNDAVFVEAAQSLARRVMARGLNSTEERAAYAFRLCTSRAPRGDELTKLVAFHDRQVGRLRSGELNAATIAGANPPLPAGVDVVEVAAWTAVSRAILNLDETMTKE
jgi:Protein of unknown function (DUF1553)/Protein of unknown function (DUF1549)/Planctomycete cytochrome C